MNAEKILVIKLRAIGDTVLSLPSLAALHAALPRAQVTFLAPGHSLALFDDAPAWIQVAEYPRDRLRTPWAHFSFLADMHARRFDVCVALHASFRSAIIALGSGAPTRVVRNHSGQDWFSRPRALEPKEAKNIIQRDFDALRALGLRPTDMGPRLWLSSGRKTRVGALAKKAGLLKGRSVLLFPHAGKPEKEWPLARFKALSENLKRAGKRVAFVVAPHVAFSEPALRLGHLLDVGALAAWAGWVVGNDSGPRHVAAASGAKTLTLFGPEALREWHPYARAAGHWALRPASGKIADLSVAQVGKAVSQWLKK